MKLYSEKALTDSQLAKLFEGPFSVVFHKEWQAYPEYVPPQKFPPTQLFPRIYFTGAFEHAASAFEVGWLVGWWLTHL